MYNAVSGSRLLAGEPVSVYGTQVIRRTGVDVRFLGQLRFPGDLTAQFHCGFDLPAESRLEAIGSEGSVLVPDPWHAKRPGFELRRGEVLGIAGLMGSGRTEMVRAIFGLDPMTGGEVSVVPRARAPERRTLRSRLLHERLRAGIGYLSEDRKEGIKARLEKRKPVWQGR